MTNLILYTLLAVAGATPGTTIVNTPHDVVDIDTEDLDVDGRRDLLVLTSDEDARPVRKSLCVFIGTTPGRYTLAPTYMLPLDESVGSIFLAEIDGKPPREVLMVEESGVTAYSLGAAGFERLGESKFGSLLPAGGKRPVFINDTAVDLDRDGIDEWMIPVASGYAIRRLDGLVANVRCEVESSISRGSQTVITHSVPSFHAFDAPGQKHRSLALINEESARFVFGEDWSEHREFDIPTIIEDKWDSTIVMEDINNDELPDIVVTQLQGSVNVKAFTEVFLAVAPYEYNTVPTNEFKADGVFSMPMIRDVNGDEYKDLVFLGVPFNVRNLINYLTRGKISVRIEVYLYGADGFPAKPSYREHITLDAPDGRAPVAYALGDFNGDKLLDVAHGEGKDKMLVHTGSKDEFLSSKPWRELALPAYGQTRTVDLTGDGRDALILFGEGTGNEKSISVIEF